MQEVEQLLNDLRGNVDPLVARRFACDCVRRIGSQVEFQRFVSPEAMEHCRRAVALTEESIVRNVDESELRSVDFEGICDNGNEAFMAAAHVGWNLFAPVHHLHEIDEFESARAIAFLAASAGGPDEYRWQVETLRQMVAREAER